MNLMTPDILRDIRQMIQDDTLIRFYKSKEWRTIRASDWITMSARPANATVVTHLLRWFTISKRYGTIQS